MSQLPATLNIEGAIYHRVDGLNSVEQMTIASVEPCYSGYGSRIRIGFCGMPKTRFTPGMTIEVRVLNEGIIK